MQLALDYYFTDFENQVVMDYEVSPNEVYFYNLQGRSYAHSAQAQLDYEVAKGLDARLAYRYNNVKTTYSGELMDKPLHAKHRSFINLAYKPGNHWHLDFTLNWQGAKRIPSTSTNPEPYQMPVESPSFFTANAQISKTWQSKYEFYLGGENLFNYVQENPIIASQDPFGQYFDSSLIWGPVFRRNIYLGFRFTLE